jgi:hypothetical protein
VTGQSLLQPADRVVDMLTIALPSGETVSVYFDLTAFQSPDPQEGPEGGDP